MKKLSILFFAMLFLFACSSGNSDKEEINDSDGNETISDSDTADISDTEGKNDSDSQEAASDTDDPTNDSDHETNDSEPVEEGGCNPNPCDTEENKAAHKSRCMPENEGTSHTCVCDVNYYSYGDLCCPAHSSEKGGKCQCDTYYTEPENEPGKCVAECTDNTIEGLNGYCKDGKICQQGTCITDRCAGYTCPENSTCSTKNDEPFCQCNDQLQMSDGKCCPLNSTNVDGTCKCNTGYELSGNECVMTANNPCKTNPCKTLNKNKCVPDSSEAGYHCECNENYTENSSGGCDQNTSDVCPDNMQCLGGFCVPQDLSNEQCVKNSDCREFDGSEAICNAQAAGGICLNCQQHSDCPGNSQCNDYGTCSLMCDTDDDCPYGKCYTSVGICGQKKCYGNEDCFNGTVCMMGEDNSGMCQRIKCNETNCSPTNPHGACPNAGEACINGSCVSSCSPNPCNETNKTCEIKLGVPSCVCVEGTEEKNGKCQPKTQTCPTGFTCKNKFCAKTSDPAFFCAENSDCGSSMTCTSPSLPSGQCHGCSDTTPCPGADEEGSTVSCLSGYCMRSCLTDDECNTGMVCKASGYCGKKDCSKPSDCPTNYTCKPTSDSSTTGTCSRIPCE